MISGLARVAVAVPTAGWDAAIEQCVTALGMPVDDYSHFTVPDLGAHVAMGQPVGGSNLELMAPSDPDAPLSRALQRFLDRRGSGPYAVMFEAPSPNDEADELAVRGMNVLPLMPGATGRDLHPNSTHGVLIRVYPDGSVAQPDEPESGPPHLSGITTVTIATQDAAAASKTYGYGLGLESTEAVADPDRGLLVATAAAPTGAMIELVSVLDPARPVARAVQDHLTAAGEGLFALTLECDDPAAACAHLNAHGLAAVESSDLGPTCTAFGTRVLLRERR